MYTLWGWCGVAILFTMFSYLYKPQGNIKNLHYKLTNRLQASRPPK